LKINKNFDIFLKFIFLRSNLIAICDMNYIVRATENHGAKKEGPGEKVIPL